MSRKQKSGRPWLSLAGLALAALFLLWQASQMRESTANSGPLVRLDALLYDWRFQLLPPQRESRLPIVIVDLDEATQQREGRWPWDRAKVAALIEALRQQGAALIGFDVVFAEPGPDPVAQLLSADVLAPALRLALADSAAEFDGDGRLADVLDPYVLLGYFFHADGGRTGVLPEPLLLLSPEAAAASTLVALPDYTASLSRFAASGASSGFVVAIPDADGVVRRVPLLLRHEQGVYASLTLEMARLALNAPWLRLTTVEREGQQVVTGVQIGRHLWVPLDEAGNLLVPYRGRAGSFPTVSATGVLRGDAPTSQLASLRDAMVLVGTSALGLSDLRTTPLQTGYPGVETHANVLDALLQAAQGQASLYQRPDWAAGAVLLQLAALGLLLALLLPGRAPRTVLLASAACVLLVLGLNACLWQAWHIALPLAAPLLLVLLLALLNIVGGYVSASRQKRAIQSLFSEYVPAAYVARMVADPQSVNLEGEQREMTVLFSDVRHFTAVSEHLAASELKALLNRYLSAITEVIFQHRGTIDKYVGDLVMAFWNAPLDDSRHAHHAVAAALAMQDCMSTLRSEFAAEGLPALQVGIGLNTGIMNVGDMGSRFRRTYTVLGDAVNLGSRLESLTAFYGVPILVSDSTRSAADAFLYRRIDLARVKGRREAVEISQPLCLREVSSPALLTRVEHFEQAVTDYRSRRWPQARSRLQTLLAEDPDSEVLYRLYLSRMQGDPDDLPADWQAIHVHESK